MTAHVHAVRAWRKLPESDVPLYRKAIQKLATGAENVQIRAMTQRAPALRLGVTTPLFSVRANKDHRVIFTRDADGRIELLDFVVRSDNAYYRGSER